MTSPIDISIRPAHTRRPTNNSGRDERLRVFLACSGLGQIRRGYESFVRACFDTLRHRPELDVHLFKGAGAAAPAEQPLRHLPRDGMGARAIGALVGRGPYVIEQVTFAASLIPHVVRRQPDVIFFCDPAIGKMLARWRRLHGGAFRLLFQNSGPIAPPFPHFDHIQQVTPRAFDDGLAAGETRDRQTLLPCALDIGEPPVLPTAGDRLRRRRALGLPDDRPVILSVGALNRAHKRMDYLIREVAMLPQPRPHLLMVGQLEADTAAVRAMATMLLGEQGFSMRSVEPEQVAEFYRAADLFALASLREGFGIVYAEALTHGLPVIAHDNAVSRYVLGNEGIFADLRESGALAATLQSVLATPATDAAMRRRHASAASRFGWQALAPAYSRMLHDCCVPGEALQPLAAV